MRLQHKCFPMKFAKFLRTLFLKNTSDGCFFFVGNTVLENTVVRYGKKHSHNKVSCNFLGSPTQADHNSRRPQYSHVFFILFICFSCAVENSRKPLLLVTYRNHVFLYFHFQLKSKKFQKAKILHTFL